MAYATSDRFGRTKVNPREKKEGFPLADGDVIFAHTLCGILAATGELCNLNGNENAVSAILYADAHLEAGALNHRVHGGAPYGESFEALSNKVVYLNATGLAAGDEGSDAFLVDDNTVTTTDAGDGSTPYVGKIEKVIAADYAAVFVPGLYRD
jgi:hypothetical protein